MGPNKRDVWLLTGPVDGTDHLSGLTRCHHPEPSSHHRRLTLQVQQWRPHQVCDENQTARRLPSHPELSSLEHCPPNSATPSSRPDEKRAPRPAVPLTWAFFWELSWSELS